MDTKWRRSKWNGPFIIVFLCVTLLLGTGMKLLSIELGPTGPGESDYQNTPEFRQYIGAYLYDFIAIGTQRHMMFEWSFSPENIPKVRYMIYDWDGLVPGSIVQDQDIVYTMSRDGTIESIVQGTASERSKAGTVPEAESEIVSDSKSDSISAEKSAAADVALQESQLRQIQQMQDALKDSSNLKYQIYSGDDLMYSNTDDNLSSGQLPDGFNFLLSYDKASVSVIKDGKAVDVYGSGRYDGTNDWSVPGYSNISQTEEDSGCRVYIAAARQPVNSLFETRIDYNGVVYTDQMYRIWSSHRTDSRQAEVLPWVVGFLLIIICLYLFRKNTRKQLHAAGDRTAAYTRRILLEIKAVCAVLTVILCVAVIQRCLVLYQWSGGMNGAMSQYNSRLAYSHFFEGCVYAVPLLFWLLLLTGNDLLHNGIQKQNSLCLRISEAFRTHVLKFPFQKQFVLRAIPIFILEGAAVLSVFAIALGVYGRERILAAAAAVCAGCLGILILILQARFYRKLQNDMKDMGLVLEQIERIRGGKLESIQTVASDSSLSAAQCQLDEIRDGLEETLKERMKSEKMKVELIANVSHDLKTPLTSIISYIELLKDEELPPHADDYVQILERKAQRLKSMVQDVFEVSKAASGALVMNMEMLDYGKLLRQTLADMQESIEKAPVVMRISIPEEAVLIEADGQRLYRVFQNLIQNALQYSLSDSRVYLTLRVQDHTACAQISNTSRDELTPDIDYGARFTRGDLSRSDEGSGLGLSIARTFTESCGGTFRIENAADLFTVCVSFTLCHIIEHEDEMADASAHNEQMEDLM